MLVLWVVAVCFVAFSDGQYQGNQNYYGGYSSRNNQRYKDEYPPEPISGQLNQNFKQNNGQQQYGQNGRQHYAQRQNNFGKHIQRYNNNRQQQRFGGNVQRPNQQYQRTYNNHPNGPSSQYRPSAKSFPNYNGQNNQKRYYKPTSAVRSNGYSNLQRAGNNGYRQKNGQNSGPPGYGNSNHGGYRPNSYNQGQQGQAMNGGYGQRPQTQGYNNGNSYQRQNNGYNGNMNGYSTGNNYQQPQPQGRALPQGGHGFGQGGNQQGYGDHPRFLQNENDLTSHGDFFDSFNEHNAGTGAHGFGEYKTFPQTESHDYGSGGENKPLELHALEKLAQTLPYDLDSVDGMGIV